MKYKCEDNHDHMARKKNSLSDPSNVSHFLCLARWHYSMIPVRTESVESAFILDDKYGLSHDLARKARRGYPLLRLSRRA
jgi:hypothetical protein